MDAAALLERSHASHRSSATCLIDRATTALADAIDEDQLTLLKRMLVEKLEVLKNLDGEITDLVPEEELEEEIQCNSRGRVYREDVWNHCKIDEGSCTGQGNPHSRL